jgi:outer membrane protein OmpA-like peptidoglycan-associated protein
MSRSAETSAWSAPTRVVLAAATVLVLVLPPPPATAAAPSAPVAPVLAPVLDLRTGTQDQAGAATVEESARATRVRLDSTLLFARDSAALRPGAARRLREIADRIGARGAGRVTVTGYTDDLGSRQHGLELSRSRAAAVAGVLRSRLPSAGFPVTVRGRGEDDPAVPNTSEANRRRNRRVLLTYLQDR